MLLFPPSRYLIGPAGKYVDNEVVLFGIETPKTSTNTVRLPDVDAADSKTNGKEITAAVLDEDQWKKVFFVMKYKSEDREPDNDLYPSIVQSM